MKKMIFAAAAMLALAIPAYAQDDHRDHGGGGQHDAGGSHDAGGQHNGTSPGVAPHAMHQPPAGGGAPHAAAPAAPPANAMRAHDNGPRDNGNAVRGPGPQDNGRQNNNAMRGPGPQDNAMRGPGPRDNGHQNNNAMRGPNGARGAMSYNQYHRNFNAPRHYHASPYRRPSGWYAHRWAYGERLPSAFFVRNYWIGDYIGYGLMQPPFGTVWVRVGDDALLIDQETGEVIQVEYGVFY